MGSSWPVLRELIQACAIACTGRECTQPEHADARAHRVLGGVEAVQVVPLGGLVKESHILRAGVAGGCLNHVHSGDHACYIKNESHHDPVTLQATARLQERDQRSKKRAKRISRIPTRDDWNIQRWEHNIMWEHDMMAGIIFAMLTIGWGAWGVAKAAKVQDVLAEERAVQVKHLEQDMLIRAMYD